MSVLEQGPNLFQFNIPNSQEKERIVDGGLWVIDNQILVLNRWEAGIERNPEAFKLAYLWVQVWNLPVHWVTREVGRKIGVYSDK